eukprot:CAMPEP_0202463344 /NCGR_PEP_ID=MMETSP1360-20130828/57769_1 /ASSEMBLY_ACC=CAM_ASM_000848 /TAXON_ID=515479 /ORGANISM="Licmophora paradoxa, Strain CCMP2313" /LENGTH=44 /DNA_ID= /DNA_START= /DNA_END= /DNA_ORIENTATION=
MRVISPDGTVPPSSPSSPEWPPPPPLRYSGKTLKGGKLRDSIAV